MSVKIFRLWRDYSVWKPLLDFDVPPLKLVLRSEKETPPIDDRYLCTINSRFGPPLEIDDLQSTSSVCSSEQQYQNGSEDEDLDVPLELFLPKRRTQFPPKFENRFVPRKPFLFNGCGKSRQEREYLDFDMKRYRKRRTVSDSFVPRRFNLQPSSEIPLRQMSWPA